jgi:hypothetical protein
MVREMNIQALGLNINSSDSRRNKRRKHKLKE